ncbi:hypothetical protein MKX03_030484 [Papaver bracteatum]|nr:hypothetical protein MKX03_030484 [Papaver bracteatum]
MYSSVTVFVFLTVFFYIDDRRNNDAAAAAAATQGLNQSAAALKLLPVLDFQKTNHVGTENKKCAICLTKFRDKDKLTLLPCKHVYHPHCIATPSCLFWFWVLKVLRRRDDVAAATTQGLNQSAAALKMFPVLVYSDFQKKNHTHTAAGTEKIECAICLTEFKGKDKLTLLPCKHVYHPRCVGTWFISKTTCPLCRTDLKSAVVANIYGLNSVLCNLVY